MMRSARSGTFWLSALLVLPAGLGGCMHTSTYGTGEMPEMAMFREVTGGLLDKNKKPAPIDYQPRAPLVMPPTAAGQLPPPAETAADANPDWPVDRDQLTADADARADDGDPRNDINQAEYRRLKPLQGVFPRQTQRQETFVSGDSGKDDYYNTVVHGRAQREQFAKAVAESKGFGGAATQRRFLTDPPVTYRQPVSADPSQPPVAVDEPKGNFITRWWRRP